MTAQTLVSDSAPALSDAAPALAAAGSNALLFAVAIGVVIVGVLIGAFWWGSRRVARRRRPVGDPTRTQTPPQPPAEPGRDSWSTPDDDPDLGDSHR
ncbi:hypothetical protein J7E93_23180 [Streptomyces sp. ISL-36]|uniref:DUF6479 family protein n=1 Tax=Streptomyces sp. ISL-36 TaxID=2819182 RepID=UPI001BE7DB6D|nr:DUF6479 family protein [Streptomyces sp. ISL-36]MBT2442957.1 hypothetical protein [Streptomyces sp. ISL-36]